MTEDVYNPFMRLSDEDFVAVLTSPMVSVMDTQAAFQLRQEAQRAREGEENAMGFSAAMRAERDVALEALERIKEGAPLTREPSGWRCQYCGGLDTHNAVCPIEIARAALEEKP